MYGLAEVSTLLSVLQKINCHQCISLSESLCIWKHPDLLLMWEYVSFKVTDGRVVRASVSVTWNMLSWSGGHVFKLQSGQIWGAYYFLSKLCLNKKYKIQIYKNMFRYRCLHHSQPYLSVLIPAICTPPGLIKTGVVRAFLELWFHDWTSIHHVFISICHVDDMRRGHGQHTPQATNYRAVQRHKTMTFKDIWVLILS